MKTVFLGTLGAIIGGAIGYAIFGWLVRQGFYALVLPGAFVGLGAGLVVRRGSLPLAIGCAIAAAALGLFAESRFFPFVADDSLRFFVTHLSSLPPITLIMIAIGAALAFWMSYRPPAPKPAA